MHYFANHHTSYAHRIHSATHFNFLIEIKRFKRINENERTMPTIEFCYLRPKWIWWMRMNAIRFCVRWRVRVIERNFNLLKFRDYSDWIRFMGLSHYIYKSSLVAENTHWLTCLSDEFNDEFWPRLQKCFNFNSRNWTLCITLRLLSIFFIHSLIHRKTLSSRIAYPWAIYLMLRN